MEQREAANAVSSLIMQLFKVPAEQITPEFWDTPLTGNTYSLDSVALTYLYLELKKRFHFHIAPEALGNYQFNTVNGIAGIILSIGSSRETTEGGGEFNEEVRKA